MYMYIYSYSRTCTYTFMTTFEEKMFDFLEQIGFAAKHIGNNYSGILSASPEIMYGCGSLYSFHFILKTHNSFA